MALIPQNTTYIQNGTSVDTNKVSNPLGVGVSQAPFCLYNVIPLTANATYVAASQPITPAVPMTLATANAITFLGTYPTVVLDCQRGLSITFAANTTNGTIVTVTGLDDRNVAVSFVAIFNTGTVAATYNLASARVAPFRMKCLSKVTSVTLSADPGVQVSIGTADVIGLPFFCPQAQYVDYIYWNKATLNIFDIATPVFIPGYQFNPVSGAGVVAQPTTATTDARGNIYLPSASDGAKMLSVKFYVYGADSYLQSQLTNTMQTAITQTGITTTTSNPLQMLTRDEVGLQFPGGA